MANHIITNSQLDSAANWDSKGKQKLIQMAWNIINNFGDTDIGAEILERIDNLEQDIFKRLGRNVVRNLIGDEALNDLDAILGVTLNAVSTADIADGYSNEFMVEADVYIYNNALTDGFGMSLNTDVPLLSASGIAVVQKYASSGALTGTEIFTADAALPSTLVSVDGGDDYVRVYFLASCVVEDSTTTDLFVQGIETGSGGQLALRSSFLRATVQAPQPITPPDPFPFED